MLAFFATAKVEGLVPTLMLDTEPVESVITDTVPEDVLFAT